MKSLSLALVLFLASLPLAQNAAAICSQFDNRVDFMGYDGSNLRLYVEVSGHDNNCGCSFFRFKEANLDIRVALAILLSARLMDQTVRIDVKDPAGPNCNEAVKIFLQPEADNP